MRSGQKLPPDQAELILSDVFVEWLEERSTEERVEILVEVEGLCRNPVGKHPLSSRGSDDDLSGWNTLDVLAGEFRVVFRSRIQNGVGLIEVLCAGPRKKDAVYDMARALVGTGLLDEDEVTEIWQALTLLDVLAEQLELDGWDFLPEKGPDGLIKAAVATGLLTEELANLLSKDELTAALEAGWAEGAPSPEQALRAALRRARAGVDPGNITRIMTARAEDRCGATLPRKKVACIRKRGHPGPHRSTA